MLSALVSVSYLVLMNRSVFQNSIRQTTSGLALLPPRQQQSRTTDPRRGNPKTKGYMIRGLVYA